MIKFICIIVLGKIFLPTCKNNKYCSVEKPVICQDFQRAFLCLLFLYLGLRFKKIAINIALIYSVFPHFQKFFFFMSFFWLKKGYSKWIARWYAFNSVLISCFRQRMPFFIFNRGNYFFLMMKFFDINKCNFRMNKKKNRPFFWKKSVSKSI